MKVLITGGAGFIGSQLVRLALAQGCTVITLDKFTYSGRLENLSDIAGHKDHHLVKGDVCDAGLLDELFSAHKPDKVFHLAAESHVDRSIDDSQAFVQTNVLGTHNLIQSAVSYWDTLEASAKQSFRFVHVSTDEVFGSLEPGDVFTEGLPYRPNSPYAATKAGSDHIVRAAGKTFGLPNLICHPANNYGVRQYPEKLIPLCILNALEGLALPIYGDGAQIRDWINVEDTVSAFWTIMENGAAGESYCISAEDGRRNLDVVTEICALLDEARPKTDGVYADQITHVADRAGHDTCYLSSAQRIRTELDWRPRVPFSEGLRTTVHWYLNNLDWWKPLREARTRRGTRKAN